LSSSGEDPEKLLAAIGCAANPTRNKILEILNETPGLGAKALADRMGVSRKHIAYHIGELKKTDLIKDLPAGTIVIYNITQLGRTALQRIRSNPPPEKPPVQAISPPLPYEAIKPSGPSSARLTGLMPALAGFLLVLLYSVFRATVNKMPSYILGGLMVAVIVFLLLAYISRKVVGWWMSK
jgi:DNA-binding transcriptional ArsR family regulator